VCSCERRDSRIPFTNFCFTVLVQGPYLVREASLSPDARTITLIGDSVNTTTIEVFAPESVQTISWNGASLETARTSYGSLTARLGGPNTEGFSLPQFGPWKVHDCLPERLPSYDDSGPAWVGECILGSIAFKTLLSHPVTSCFADLYRSRRSHDNPQS